MAGKASQGGNRRGARQPLRRPQGFCRRVPHLALEEPVGIVFENKDAAEELQAEASNGASQDGGQARAQGNHGCATGRGYFVVKRLQEQAAQANNVVVVAVLFVCEGGGEDEGGGGENEVEGRCSVVRVKEEKKWGRLEARKTKSRDQGQVGRKGPERDNMLRCQGCVTGVCTGKLRLDVHLKMALSASLGCGTWSSTRCFRTIEAWQI